MTNPLVSIIVPCLNEEDTITKLLQAIYDQSLDRFKLEVILADGMSTDRTRQRVAEFQSQHGDLALRIIDNPSRRIPSGLNLAIAAAQSEYILRLDAHSMPRPDYVQRSVDGLRSGKGWNVGGIWEIKPTEETWIAKSIAIAAAHPLGVGDALYRYATEAGAVDTVPFGAFERKLIKKVGLFDEGLQANEDYEFNARIRAAGGTVWLDPQIRSIYFSRANLVELARQYARYGFWKVRMLRRYPGTLRLRQAIPPLFVLSLFVLIPASFAWIWAKFAFQVEMVSYALLLIFVSTQKAIQHRQLSFVVGIPLAMMTMHLSWGAAFLWSLISREGQKKPQTNGR